MAADWTLSERAVVAALRDLADIRNARHAGSTQERQHRLVELEHRARERVDDALDCLTAARATWKKDPSDG